MQVLGKSNPQELSSAETRGAANRAGEIAAVNAAAKNLAIDVFQPELFAGKSYFAQLKIFEDVCGQVYSKAWQPCSDKLKSFIQARMEKNVAVDLFFGSGSAKQIGGICHGMSEVWNALHAANPDASSMSRMALLMGEKGMSLAFAAQKIYAAEHLAESRKAIGATPEQQQLQTMTWGEFNMQMFNNSSLCGLHFKLVSQDLVSTEKEYVAMAKKLSRDRGYYQFSVLLKENSPNGESGAYVAHALRVFSNGSGKNPASLGYWKSALKNIRSGQAVEKSLILYDSNLGECHVLPEEMGQFMEELAKFYKTSRNCGLVGITEIYSSEIKNPIDETILQGLNSIDPAHQPGAPK